MQLMSFAINQARVQKTILIIVKEHEELDGNFGPNADAHLINESHEPVQISKQAAVREKSKQAHLPLRMRYVSFDGWSCNKQTYRNLSAC